MTNLVTSFLCVVVKIILYMIAAKGNLLSMPHHNLGMNNIKISLPRSPSPPPSSKYPSTWTVVYELTHTHTYSFHTKPVSSYTAAHASFHSGTHSCRFPTLYTALHHCLLVSYWWTLRLLPLSLSFILFSFVVITKWQ